MPDTFLNSKDSPNSMLRAQYTRLVTSSSMNQTQDVMQNPCLVSGILKINALYHETATPKVSLGLSLVLKYDILHFG